eukprot:jgi/Mesvir1/14420/Mv09802-RA.1
MGTVRRFVRGLYIAFVGCGASVSNRSVLLLYKKFFKRLAIATAIFLIIGHTLLLPFQLLFSLFDLITHEAYDITRFSSAAYSWLLQFGLLLPFVAVMLLRLLCTDYLEALFFTQLAATEPELAAYLQSMHRESLWHRIRRLLSRVQRLLLLSLLLYLLSRLPAVGPLVGPLAQAYIVVKVVGVPKAVALAVASMLVPGMKAYALQFVDVWKAASIMSIELMDPYLSRTAALKAAGQGPPVSTRSRMLLDKTSHAVKAFRKEHDDTLQGFALPFMALMYVPWVGPLVFITGQAAAALLLADFIARDSRSASKIDGKAA